MKLDLKEREEAIEKNAMVKNLTMSNDIGEKREGEGERGERKGGRAAEREGGRGGG